MEPEGSGSTVASVENVHVPTNAEQLQTELKTWCASAVRELHAAETERKYTLSRPPKWKCIMCAIDIETYPVYQCVTGHLACNSCSKVGATCRSCSKAVSRIKNRAVENMMDSLMVTCKFAELGCKEVNPFKEQSVHEKFCSFMPLVCPMPSCKQAGVKNLLAEHLLAVHQISREVEVGRYGPHDEESRQHTREFVLGSTSTLVLLRRQYNSKELHLLHQQSTALGDRLQITSLAKSPKREYELHVKISAKLTYCYKSVSTPNTQPDGGLLIPKQADGDSQKFKHCTVYMQSDTQQWVALKKRRKSYMRS